MKLFTPTEYINEPDWKNEYRRELEFAYAYCLKLDMTPGEVQWVIQSLKEIGWLSNLPKKGRKKYE